MRFNPNTGEFEPDNIRKNPIRPSPNKKSSGGGTWIIIIVSIVIYLIIKFSKQSESTTDNSFVVDSVSVAVDSSAIADTVAITDSTFAEVESVDTSTITLKEESVPVEINDIADNSTIEKTYIRNTQDKDIYISLSCVSSNGDNYQQKTLFSNSTTSWVCENSDYILIKIITTENGTDFIKEYRLEKGIHYKIKYNENGVLDVYIDN